MHFATLLSYYTRFIKNLPEMSTLNGSQSDPTELDHATEYLELMFCYTLDNVALFKRKIRETSTLV